MSLNINREELDVKNKLIDNAIVQLKKEFIGIDEQIDSIMNNVRVWFLYPQLQTTPCVVNIFGMTGCGKTSLVRRIAQLLEIEKDLVYFNFCSINEQSSWEVEQDIEEQLDNESSRRMFVYDEFQYAATIDGMGAEKDNKNGLKPFWELLDTGVLHKRTSFWQLRDLYKVLTQIMKINAICPMEIVNGTWVNQEECLAGFTPYDRKQLAQTFNLRRTKKQNGEEDDDDDDRGVGIVQYGFMHETFDDESLFLNGNVLQRFTENYRKVCNVVCDISDVYRKLIKMNIDEILIWFKDVYDKSLVGYDLKFNDSIIFVIANLDEAYEVAFNVNPDMSPDQFNALTKKVSIVDVKKALQKRFRNEQIARLGNIHVIYPAFTSKAFKKIIEQSLDAYKNTAKDLCGLDVKFDKSIHKVIFDEAVYPTQGTRPIFSTIHEIIKAKLPLIIRNICDNNKDAEASSLVYAYKNKKSVISVLDDKNNVIDTYKFVDQLRLNQLRASTKDEQQANTAVHESGHFVVHAYLNGAVPEKLISRSAEKETEGFMMNSIDNEDTMIGSRIDYLNKIKIALGGYVAEGLIFGDDRRSGGASADLLQATKIASMMVRKLGMGDIAYVTTYLKSPETGGMTINEGNQDYINEKIKTIINKCLEDTIEIINQPHMMNMLKKSAKYLAQHSQMPKHVMNELLDEARKNGDICENNDNFYRNIVNNF